MDKKELEALLSPKPTQIESTTHYSRVETCKDRYRKVARNYLEFFVVTGCIDKEATPRITIGKAEHPELGSGEIKAYVWGFHTEDGYKKPYSAHSAYNFETVFKFVNESGVEAGLGAEVFDARLDGEIEYPIFAEVSWSKGRLHHIEKMLDEILPRAQSTLDMLVEAASNYELNPNLAETARAYYADRLQNAS